METKKYIHHMDKRICTITLCTVGTMACNSGLLTEKQILNDQNSIVDIGASHNDTNNGTVSNGNQDDSESGLTTSDPFFNDTGLPNILFDLDKTFCDLQFKEIPQVPGAVSYFAGAYVADGNNYWMGREKWVLFPNDRWIAIAQTRFEEGETDHQYIAAGQACEVTWNLDVIAVESFDCPTCEFVFEVFAEINTDATNCPYELWNEAALRTWTSTYEVEISDQSASFYFQSGQSIGLGYASEDAVNFISDPSCMWF